MKTDSIFYQLFKTFPDFFFELIGQPAACGNVYQFQSVELKATSKRIDGVLLPDPGNTEAIYFVEIQFQVDQDFYYRFITEIYLYLGQYQPQRDWRAVAIFRRQSIDPGVPVEYRNLVLNQQLQLFYLDTLDETAYESVGLGIVKLIVENDTKTRAQALRLIQKVQQQVTDEQVKRKVLELIEVVLVYKLPQLSYQEIEAMFGISDLKNTRVYKQGKEEGKEEGKLEAVPRLLKLGLSVEQIADALELDVEVIKQAARREG